MPLPDIHRSARKHYAKGHLGDEDLRHAYGHVLYSRRWMIWQPAGERPRRLGSDLQLR